MDRAPQRGRPVAGVAVEGGAAEGVVTKRSHWRIPN